MPTEYENKFQLNARREQHEQSSQSSMKMKSETMTGSMFCNK